MIKIKFLSKCIILFIAFQKCIKITNSDLFERVAFFSVWIYIELEMMLTLLQYTVFLYPLISALSEPEKHLLESLSSASQTGNCNWFYISFQSDPFQTEEMFFSYNAIPDYLLRGQDPKYMIVLR